MAPRQVVVDGSNIATEGRSTPSLAQLDQAVREFLVEYPEAIVTVVVDASFAHRIAASELSMYEEAEAAGEVVSPPAGAIGRGDAFLLRIADKTGAMVLSNDSFQEFHGEHEWLFDKGRLIGGKPVPGVGWIFTPRTPVRGPKSREAVKEAKRNKKGDDEPRIDMPGLDLAAVRARSMGKEKKSVDRAIAVATEEAVAPNESKRRRRRKGNSPPAEAVNDPLTFITFIAAHPLGSEVQATVESFASHGAFVEVEGARCYVPLSAMGSPAPKSAREVFAKGDEVQFVIQALDPQRRGVELALPGFANVAGAPTEETVEAEIARDSGTGDLDIDTDTNIDESGPEVTPPARRAGTGAGRRPDVKKAAPARPRSTAGAGDAPTTRRARGATKAASSASEGGSIGADDGPAQRARSRAASEEVLAERRAARRARLAEEAASQSEVSASSESSGVPAPAPRRGRRGAVAVPGSEAAAVPPAEPVVSSGRRGRRGAVEAPPAVAAEAVPVKKAAPRRAAAGVSAAKPTPRARKAVEAVASAASPGGRGPDAGAAAAMALAAGEPAQPIKKAPARRTRSAVTPELPVTKVAAATRRRRGGDGPPAAPPTPPAPAPPAAGAGAVRGASRRAAAVATPTPTPLPTPTPTPTPTKRTRKSVDAAPAPALTPTRSGRARKSVETAAAPVNKVPGRRAPSTPVAAAALVGGGATKPAKKALSTAKKAASGAAKAAAEKSSEGQPATAGRASGAAKAAAGGRAAATGTAKESTAKKSTAKKSTAKKSPGASIRGSAVSKKR